MELDQMVGPLLHPIVGHRAEIHGLAADLQRGEIADLGQAPGVLLGQRRELLFLHKLAGRREALRGEGRIHLVENPVVNHRGNLSVRRERDLALDGDPDMGMRASRRRGRKPEREPQRRASPIPLSAAHSDASLLAKCGDEMARRLNHG